VWRDDTGSLNAWENRCPHRGVRFSIGCNTGAELRCQYHGWRYASGSGRCTRIPAHPNQKPSSNLRATVYRAAERYGFAWVSLAPQAALPALPGLESSPSLSLRSTFVEAPAARVRELLMSGYPFAPDPDAPDAPLIPAAAVAHDEYRLTASAVARDTSATVTFFLAPVSATQALIHATLQAPGGTAEPLAVRRHHHARLCALRDAAERQVPGLTEKDP
jgi:nitrite reductase/ring-hydroxylating ferredoxin subunit